MTDFVVVLTTLGADADASALAATLVERRLAACVNIVPGVQSVYRWQGRIEREGEQLLVMKSSRPMLAALEAALMDLHPYDTPEFVVLPIEAIGAAYGRWFGESVG